MRNLFRFFDSRIELKIILPFAVLTLALALIGTYLSTRLVSGSLDERFENQLTDATTVVADLLLQREQFQLAGLRKIAFSEGVNAAVAAGDQTLLADILFPIVINDGLDRVDIIANDGSTLLTIRQPPGSSNVNEYQQIPGGGNLADHTTVQKVLAGVIDDQGDKHVEIALIDDDELFITAGPITHEGRVVGAILVSSHLQNLLLTLKQATFTEVSIYDAEGQIRRTTIPSGLEESNQLRILSEEIEVLTKLEGNTSSRRSVQIRGREYDILPGIFWARGQILGYYSVALQTTTIVDRGNSARNQMAAIFVSALLLVFAIGFLTSNMITGRVQHLMENALAVAAGDLTRRTELGGNDEIGSLAQSLDDMTASLAEYTSALQNKIDELTALYESSTAVTVKSGLNLEQVLQTVTTSVKEVMQEADQVVVHLLDEDHETLAPIASVPNKVENFPSYAFKKDSKIDILLGMAKPQIIQLTEIEDYLLNGVPSATFSASKAMITPLVAGQETIGMLTLTFVGGSAVQASFLTEDSERLLGTFANQAAIAIKNAQLFEATQYAFQELQQLDQLKTEFINIAAHELRTPLGAILGHASSVEKRAPPKLKKYISFITISALRMRTMIDAMLTIQRLDAGTAFLKIMPTNMAKMIKKVVADYRPMAELEGHTIEVNVADNLPTIQIDAEKVGLAVANLISNAIKFTPEGGQVEVAAEDYGDSLLVTIRDNGVGISPEDQRQIFERFYQVRFDDVAAHGNLGVGAGHGGMGLGLTIVKHLIDLHHGEVWVESQPGEGSTFFITLPKDIETQHQDMASMVTSDLPPR